MQDGREYARLMKTCLKESRPIVGDIRWKMQADDTNQGRTQHTAPFRAALLAGVQGFAVIILINYSKFRSNMKGQGLF